MRDSQALPLQAAVTLQSNDGSRRQTLSDSDGHFFFTGVENGLYHVKVSREGFAEMDVQVVVPLPAGPLQLQAKPANTSTEISVVAVEQRSTASRMDIPNSELPVTLNEIPHWALESQGVNDLVTALRNVSGVTATRNYGVYEYYTIRGFNQGDVQLIDGMRLEGNRVNTQLNNIERVDVLKGPSSILYGAQALGGAINIVRKKPQPTRTFDFLYRSGRFNLNQVAGGTTGSVGRLPNLFYRVDSSFQYSDGWRGAGAKQFNLSPSLTWLINEKTKITIFEGFTNDRYTTDAGIPVALITQVPSFDLSRRFDTSQDFSKFRDLQTQVLANHTLTNQIELRNSFFYRRQNDQYYTAETLAYVPSLNQVNRTFLYFYHHRRPIQDQADAIVRANLFRIKHLLLIGYEYQDYYNYTDRCSTCSVAISPINLQTFIDTYQPISSFPVSRRDYFANRINAFFWQDQISVSEHLKLNVGGRYDNYLRKSRNDPWANGTPTSRTPDTVLMQDAYTYRAGVTYELPANNQIYASTSTAFEPVTTVPASGPALIPQTGRSYELGHRLQTYHGRLNFNTALYRIVRENVVIALPNALYDQAGQQSSKGIEEDITGDAGHGIRLIANYGYTLPRFDNYFASNGTVNLTGKMPSFTQRHAANLWLTKLWNSGWDAGLGVRYVSRMYADNANQYSLNSYTLVNGRVGYARGRYEWSATAENLLNRRKYFTSAIYSSQVYPGSPINVFGSFRIRFQ